MKDHSLGMDDKEFASLAQAALIRIQSGLENAGLDFETPGDGILKIDFDDGSKMVINRHGAAQEVWVAARSGGFHFRPTDGSWKDSRDGEDLYVKLAEADRAAGWRGSLVLNSAHLVGLLPGHPACSLALLLPSVALTLQSSVVLAALARTNKWSALYPKTKHSHPNTISMACMYNGIVSLRIASILIVN